MRNYLRNIPLRTVIAALGVAVIVLASCDRDYDVNDGLKEVEFKATADKQLITEGESITFIDSSLNVASRIWSIQKDFEPTFVTSDQEIFAVTFDRGFPAGDGGVYPGLEANLEVTFADGRVENNRFLVSVYPKIGLDFSSNLTTAIVGSTIQFTNLSTDLESNFEDAKELDTFLWEFQGGSPSTSMTDNPSVLYTQPGTYAVSVTAKRQGPEDNASITRTGYITIVSDLALVPEFTADVTEISADQAVAFTNASTGGADSYSWSFPGGMPETSTEQNPVVTYASGGFYDVTLEITRNADGTVETLTKLGFVAVDSPFCNTPDNLVGCGNNDGEGDNLVDWIASLDAGDGGSTGDRTDNLSISAEQFFSGASSIKFSYLEPGAPAFTDNLIDYNGKLVDVTEAGNYTVSMQHFGAITGGTEYVLLFGLVNSTTGQYSNNFGRFNGEVWNATENSYDLEPGQYFVRVQLFNPGFNASQSIDIYMDDIKVVRN